VDDIPSAVSPPFERFFLGNYTESGGRGIGCGWIDPTSGRLTVESWTAVVNQPSTW
jgi:hypothetical protein